MKSPMLQDSCYLVYGGAWKEQHRSNVLIGWKRLNRMIQESTTLMLFLVTTLKSTNLIVVTGSHFSQSFTSLMVCSFFLC